MKVFLTTIIASVIFYACESNQGSSDVSQEAAVDTSGILTNARNKLIVQTISFSEIDSSGIIMFPLTMSETKEKPGKSYYKEIPYNNYWNVIFYNIRDSQMHLLSERKMLIRSIYVGNDNSYLTEELYTGKFIFYEVAIDDLNTDKKLTTDDPDYLFISDRKGNGFKQVSPAGYSLLSWEYFKSTNRVVMAVRSDSDKDKEFDDEDEVTSFQMDIALDSLPTEIFPAEFKNNLKILFDKNWRKIEN